MNSRCPVCNKRKGKRKCPLYTVICSQCCGQTRLNDRCPSDCSYMKKSQQFGAHKELTRHSYYEKIDLEYFNQNQARLMPLLYKIEKGFFEILSRDMYYTDKLLLEGLKRSQKYFKTKTSEQDQEVSLNRLGVIETSVREIIWSYKLENGSLTNKDIQAAIGFEIMVINQHIEEGDGSNYCLMITEHFHENTRHSNSNSLIIP